MAKSEADIKNALEKVLTDYGQDLQGSLTKEYRKWVEDMTPRIALHATLAAQGDIESQKDLEIIKALAIAKAANMTITGVNSTSTFLGNLAVLAARFAVALV